MRIIGIHLASIAAPALFAAETGTGSGSRTRASSPGGGETPVPESNTTPTEGAAAVAHGEPANITAATEFDPSGAPRQVVGDVDPGHPAVDNDPRAGTTVDQNRIDFNDPTLSGSEAVARNLADQAKD